MAIQNRDTLKKRFKNGEMPTQRHFEDLIDSMVNKADDGLSKCIDHGLMLAPEGKSTKLVSFYKSIEEKVPAWAIELAEDSKGKALQIGEEGRKEPAVFIQSGGNMGIGTATPGYDLDVNGLAGMKGRIGTFRKGEVPGNGKWQTIAEGLDGCNALEVMAGIGGLQGEGKYALLHAIAVSTYGRSKSKIKKVQAHYGWFWNKLCIRWSGTTFNYSLQVRTRRNYGEGVNIKFHISKLWDDREMGMPLQLLRK